MSVEGAAGWCAIGGEKGRLPAWKIEGEDSQKMAKESGENCEEMGPDLSMK